MLRKALKAAADVSFNRITIDGDMSTNDTVAVLANGEAGNARLSCEGDEGYESFKAALLHITQNLAQQIAFDGEGATKAATIEVTGAESFEQAREMGKRIATYNLFKTMLYGMDFNWGRVAAAIEAQVAVPASARKQRPASRLDGRFLDARALRIGDRREHRKAHLVKELSEQTRADHLTRGTATET